MGTTLVLHADLVSEWLAALTLLSTLLLAFFTWRLARATKQLSDDSEKEFQVTNKSANAAVEAASASRRQAEISERSLESLIRPWITAGEYTWDEEDSSDYPARFPLVTLSEGYGRFAVFTQMKLQNVGPGIALIDTNQSWLLGRSQFNEPDEVRPFTNLFTETPVVPPQSNFFVVGRISPASAHWSGLTPEKFAYPRSGMTGIKGNFVMTVAYTDAGGNNPVTAEFHIVVEPGLACRIFKIRYLKTDTGSEFAEVIVGSVGN